MGRIEGPSYLAVPRTGGSSVPQGRVKGAQTALELDLEIDCGEKLSSTVSTLY